MYKLMLAILIPLLFAPAHAEPWDAYDTLLQQHVHRGEKYGVSLNLVDYSALRKTAEFSALLIALERQDPAELHSREQKLAFYINAYNIYAIKMVLDHWPVDSIRDIGGFFSPVWKKPVGMLGGRSVSLHEIEHEILRKMAEPRIHMAIVCASVSCPDLRLQAYRAEQLDQQLAEQSRRFLANGKKGLSLQGRELHISKIFDWFEADFRAVGGVLGFIKQYRPGLPMRVTIDDYLDYDWRLNSTAP